MVSRHCTGVLLTVAVVFTLYDLLGQRPTASSSSLPRSDHHHAAEGDTSFRPLHESIRDSSKTAPASWTRISSSQAKSSGVGEDSGTKAKWTHVHLCAIGDSMTEGIARVFSNPRRLKYFPYAPMVAEMLRGHRGVLSSSFVASVSHHTFAFKGKTAAGILHEAASRMFGPHHTVNTNRTALFGRGGSGGEMGRTPKLAVVPSGLARVLTTGRTLVEEPNTTAANFTSSASSSPSSPLREVPVEQVLIICSVMAGTNDVLRAEGSTVATPVLPPVPIATTLSSILDLLALCVRYHTQLRLELKGENDAEKVPHVSFLLLPLGLPPVMFDPSSEVLRDVIHPFLSGKSAGKRSLFGYCLTPFSSWSPMSKLRDEIHNILVSPGQFHDDLERLAADFLASRDQFLGAGVASTNEVANFDTVLPDNQTLWTDCLHLSEVGYTIMATRIAQVIKQQT